MKFKKIGGFALLIVLVINGCKRADLNNLSSRTIKKEIVEDWLNQKIGNGQGLASGIAKNIKENLMFNEAWENDYRNGEKIITIPISNNVKFKNNATKTTNNYLVLFKNANNKVFNGYIWQAIDGAMVTKNTLANMYNHVKEDLQGTYCLLDIKDNFKYQKRYENNKEAELWMRQIKPSTTAVNSGTLVCNDYYVLHTEYNYLTGEILNQSVLYTFQVCNCTPNNQVQSTIIGPGECDPNGDTSGGGDPCLAIKPDFDNETATTSTPQTMSVDASASPAGEETPFSKTWTVCEGTTWKVESTISGIYKRYFVSGLPTFLVNVRNVAVTPGSYSGSQVFAKTKWNPLSNVATVLNQDTHTASAYGVVTGRLDHKCTGISYFFGPAAVALCPNLNRSDDISNSATVAFN